jgi:hypothetical protein
MAVKLLLVGMLAGAALLAAVLGARLAGGSAVAAGGAAAALLAFACAPLTCAVAWAFERFDVARDVPA